jgi:small subunit ribosomal protein S20
LASSKSAAKQARARVRKELRNKATRSLCRTRIVKAEKLISNGDVDAASSAVNAAVSSLDKAAEKGILHRNNTARRKSRLIKKLNQLAAPPAPDDNKVAA